MLLEHLTLADVRNYATLEFAPAPGLNLLVGSNAQGKSNLLEAIAMLGTGKSFRTSREGEVIRFGLPLGSVSGSARVGAGKIRLACTIARTPGGTRKHYTLNGETVRYGTFLGSVKVVTFVPADLALITGPPALRRSFLNEALSLAEPRYYRQLARYRKTLGEKNALLRGAVAFDPDLLATYESALVESGTALMIARRHYLAGLGELAGGIAAGWVRGERLEVRYLPNVPIEVPTEDAIAAAFRTRLAEQRGNEAARKTSLVGPHRDDIGFSADAQALAAYGSQGQNRTAVLALKVAEYTILRQRTAEAPLLLLDDVLSELDPLRAQRFVEALGGVEQAFVTATQRPPVLGDGPTVWEIAAATVRAC
ncbi:MAG: DNA replication/repair protein RecF [Candidatus Eremiobacteraeota bacterium]|nr:DNA replication/repair protein RecF [Candidatus Eremiobacteraeota bacterium]MBV8354604.1 DNA replication/repair protein RecF [Candidatus Eremiobacteraeota bacterium]